jgi:hypothetical protein
MSILKHMKTRSEYMDETTRIATTSPELNKFRWSFSEFGDLSCIPQYAFSQVRDHLAGSLLSTNLSSDGFSVRVFKTIEEYLYAFRFDPIKTSGKPEAKLCEDE